MTSKRQRLPKSAAKVEFIIHAETVKSMLQSGFNMRNIYNKLCELHNLSMSYFTLCALSRKTFKEEKNKERAKPMTPPTSSIPASPKRLTRPEDVDRGSLF